MSLGLVFPEDISVWINGEEIGAVKGWSSVSQRELYEVQAMEEQEYRRYPRDLSGDTEEGA